MFYYPLGIEAQRVGWSDVGERTDQTPAKVMDEVLHPQPPAVVLQDVAEVVHENGEGDMTFEFDADGFLTDRRGMLEAGISRAHDGLFARARQINRDCHELLIAADIRNRDVQAILVATLFMRTLEHYQATLLLLGTGLIAPAKVALRATLESTFATRAVAADEEALRAFINDDLLQRRRLIRRAQQHDHIDLEELREALTDDLIKTLDQQIKATGRKTTLTTEDLSKYAGLHDWYTTRYALLSKAAHTNVRELEAYLLLDEDGHIRGLEYAPSINEIPHLVLTAAQCVLFAAAAVAGTFEIDFQIIGSEHLKFIEAGFQLLNENDSP